MIGIKEDPQRNEEAIQFLSHTLSGKHIFLKFGEQKYDNEGHILAYLYLENKTFINAHLLKKKLALVDNSINFKYLTKFNTLYYG